MAFWDRFGFGFSLLRFDYFDWKTDFRRGVLQYIPTRLKWQISRNISEITISVDLSIWTIFSEPQSALIRANAEYFRLRSKCKILSSSGVTRKTRFKRANKMCSSYQVSMRITRVRYSKEEHGEAMDYVRPGRFIMAQVLISLLVFIWSLIKSVRTAYKIYN